MRGKEMKGNGSERRDIERNERTWKGMKLKEKEGNLMK